MGRRKFTTPATVQISVSLAHRLHPPTAWYCEEQGLHIEIEVFVPDLVGLEQWSSTWGRRTPGVRENISRDM
jgi:hypothetical protein